MTGLRFPMPPTFLDVPGEPTIKFSQWVSQLENFFYLTNCSLAANKQLSDKQKVAYVPLLLGAEGIRIVAAHSVSNRWKNIRNADFKAELKTLFERSKNPVRAQFDFRQRQQGNNETVNEYITALRTLIADCDINDNDQEKRQLAMQLVIGCKVRTTQEKLLAEATIDLDKFLTIMHAEESASQTSTAIRQETTVAAATKSQPSNNKRPDSTNNNTKPTSNKYKNNTQKPKSDHCFGCGSTAHRLSW
jgi:hypothetical protein